MATLDAGARLGPYEILGALGAGGMGTVYRARDTRLGRDVAIKCISPELGADAASRARIEREARSVASLSHPNICPLHDVGTHDGATYLVMELLEGETLAARLRRARSGLPLDEALGIATQIADAMAYAHQRQIVHRDLKPANVMLTRAGARLLDFGLAKPSSSTDDTGSLITHANERLGTPAYMAPEQLAGAADHRSDTYSFGAVLFEMLTGVKAFASNRTLATLRPGTPPPLDRLVRKCLEKDVEKRWQSAADLADELRWLASEPSSATEPIAAGGRGSRTVYLLVAAVAVIGALVAIGWPWRAAAPAAATHLAFVVPEGVEFPTMGAGVAIAPDGSTIAFSAAIGTGAGATPHLFVKRLDAPDVQLISGSNDAAHPIFSPDGESVAFIAQRKLKRWSSSGGAISEIADLSNFVFPSLGSWSADGTILLSDQSDRPDTGISRVPATGGAVEVITRPDNANGEQTHFGALQLDDGTILFTIRSSGPNGIEYRIAARKTDGSTTTVIPGASFARPFGRQLLYQVGNTVMLASFDPASLAVTTARPIAGDVLHSTIGAAWAGSADVLAYRGVHAPRRRLVWVDRAGTVVPTGLPDRDYVTPALSPAGDRLVVTVVNVTATDIWIADLRQQTLTQATQSRSAGGAVWSRDGSMFFARRSKGAATEIIQQRADGSGDGRAILDTDEMLFVADESPDRRTLVVMKPTNGNRDIWLLDLKNGQLRPIVQQAGVEYGGRVSPDGKWMSFFSQGAADQAELFVTPFPGGGPRWQISRDGAREAVWSRDGTELFYRSRERMMSVKVKPGGDRFDWDSPQALFSGAFFSTGGPGNVQYDVAPDGRFLMIEELPLGSPPINVVLGWPRLAQ